MKNEFMKVLIFTGKGKRSLQLALGSINLMKTNKTVNLK